MSVHFSVRTPAGKRTYDFLHQISYHLSGRADCRKQEYMVCIGADYFKFAPTQMRIDESSIPKNRVSIYPIVEVFPNTYNRKKAQLRSVTDHVILNHFQDDVFSHVDNFGVFIREGSLVEGVYKYALSFDGRRRRWIKIK